MKIYRTVVIVFLFVFACIAPQTLIFAQKENKSPENFFYAMNFSKSDGIYATVYLNDIPVQFMGNDYTSQTGTVNMWLVPGENTVSLKIAQGKKPPSVPFSEDAPGFKLFVSEALEGQFPEEGKKLVDIEWPKDMPPKLPFEAGYSFKVEHAPSTDFWTSAIPFELTDEVKKNIFELLKDFQYALEKKKMSRIVELMDYRMDELNKALYSKNNTEAKRKKEIEETYKEILTKTAVVKSLKYDELEFYLAGGKRMVWVTRKDMKPALKITDGDSVLEFPVYAAPVNGKWTFVR